MPAPSLEDMLSELDKLADAATPGPWEHRVSSDSFSSVCYGDDRNHPAQFIWEKQTIANELRWIDAEYIERCNPAFIKELIAAVRSALSPSMELPERPEFQTIYHDSASVICGPMPIEGFVPREVIAYADKIESLLRAANAEADRLKEAARDIEVLRRRIHLVERHNQFFERCESLYCNPNGTISCMADGYDKEYLAIPCGDPAKMERIRELEAQLATAHASGKLEGRKEALEAVKALKKPDPLTWRLEGYNTGIDDAEKAILALGPVSPASDPRREQMEIDATFMCGMCAEGLPMEKVDGRFMHNHTSKLECRAAPLRAHFERQAVLARPEAAK